jgi:large subunit ribosomal protein L17
MRHGDKVNNLSRKKGHRVALLRNMAASLIIHKRINTTLAKAKALRIYVEPIITKAKDNTTHARRVAFSYLGGMGKEASKELFGVVSPKVGDRPGGYTRIIKLGTRKGDGAEMAMIELVDFNEIYGKNIGTAAEPAKKTRRSGGGAKAKAATTADDIITDAVIETVPAPKAAATSGADDLTIIEGIGPKAAEVLVAAGIVTFADLAATAADKVKEILTASTSRVGHLDPTTWAQQAQLAADGKMDELEELKAKLNNGKEA